MPSLTGKLVMALALERHMKRMTQWLFSAALVASLSLGFGQANATIFTIGDSLSDAGALGFTYTNPVALSPLREGNVWVQHLTNSVPAFCNDPKHCRLDNDTFYYSSRGNNYAVGGAGINFDSTDIPLAQSFTSLHYQVEALTHNHKLTPNDVVTVWIGANDIIAAATDPTLGGVSFVMQAATTMKREVARLARSGGNVIVLSIPDIGTTPLGLNSSTDVARSLSELTNVFNGEISGLANLKNVKLIDSKQIYQQLLQSGEFDNTAIYCNAIIDPNNICGSAANPLQVNKPEPPLVFADPIHPSNAAHRWIGDFMKKLLH
jgi:outer membrane lipase/esterase